MSENSETPDTCSMRTAEPMYRTKGVLTSFATSSVAIGHGNASTFSNTGTTTTKDSTNQDTSTLSKSEPNWSSTSGTTDSYTSSFTSQYTNTSGESTTESTSKTTQARLDTTPIGSSKSKSSTFECATGQLAIDRKQQQKISSAYKKVGRRRVYLVRTAERADKVIPNLNEQKSTIDDKYKVSDLNQPFRMEQRRGGPTDHINDAPITEMGLVTARFVGRDMDKGNIQIDRVLVSPALRCIQTANAILSQINTKARICIEPGLFESLGQYQHCGLPKFMTPSDLAQLQYPIDLDYKPVFPMDTLKSIMDQERTSKVSYGRLVEVVMEMITKREPNSQGVLIVGHGITLDACGRYLNRKNLDIISHMNLNDLCRLGLHYPYCCGLTLEQRTDHWALIPTAFTPLTYLDISTAPDVNYFNRT